MQKDWHQATIKITDGIELFYTRTGKGEKPPIVLAHGITDNGLCWHQFASELEDNYDLIMYDEYGHGKSSRVDAEKRFDLSENLFDLIKALKLEKPCVIGHSMGAATTAVFAAKHPDSVSTIILEDPPWSDRRVTKEDLSATMVGWKEKHLKYSKLSEKELIKRNKKRNPDWEEAILKEWAQAKLEMDPAFFDQFPIRPVNWTTLVKDIQVPTLIVTGDNDEGAIVTPKLGLKAVTLLKNGEFGHISSAGHCVRYAQFRPYVTMIKVFLKRNFQS